MMLLLLDSVKYNGGTHEMPAHGVPVILQCFPYSALLQRDHTAHFFATQIYQAFFFFLEYLNEQQNSFQNKTSAYTSSR